MGKVKNWVDTFFCLLAVLTKNTRVPILYMKHSIYFPHNRIPLLGICNCNNKEKLNTYITIYITVYYYNIYYSILLQYIT